MWVATGLVAGLIYLPRATRLAIDTLAVLAGADMLQFGYARLQEQATEARTSSVTARSAGRPR